MLNKCKGTLQSCENKLLVHLEMFVNHNQVSTDLIYSKSLLCYKVQQKINHKNKVINKTFSEKTKITFCAIKNTKEKLLSLA